MKKRTGKETNRSDGDIDFEESRMRILQMSGGKAEKPASVHSGERKHAWEYELQEHRKRKRLEMFLIFTSVLSIAGFLISMFLFWWIFMKA